MMEVAHATGSVNIRRATVYDLPEIMSIEYACFSEPWWTESHFRAALADDGTRLVRRIFVAEANNGNAVGFAVLNVLRLDGLSSEAELQNLATRPGFRKQGVGSSLLNFAMNWAAQMGAVRLRLEVRVSNVAAQRLYRDFGFQMVGRRARYYTNPPEDGLVLEAPLRPSFENRKP